MQDPRHKKCTKDRLWLIWQASYKQATNAKTAWEQTERAAGLMIHVWFGPYVSLHRHGTTRKDFFYLGKLPLLVAKRTGTPCLEPALNAIQVKDMSTITPSNTQSRMISITSGVGLVLDTRLI